MIRLVDRMFMLLHPSFHQKNLELIVNILLENDHPLNFIFRTISNRIRHLITNSNNKTQNDQKISYLDDKIINSWFVIPYFGSYSEKFREFVDVSDMRVSILWSQQVTKYHQVTQRSTFRSLQKECGI